MDTTGIKDYRNEVESTTAQEKLLIHQIQEKQKLLQNYIPVNAPDLEEQYKAKLQNGEQPIAMDETEVLKAEAELEKLQNKLIKLQNTKTKINIDSDFDPNDTSGMKINGEDFEVKKITGYSNEILKLKGNIEQLKAPATEATNEFEKTANKVKEVSSSASASLNNVDTTGFRTKLQSAIEAVKAKLQELKSGNNDFNFTGSEKQLELLKYKISEVQEKLEQVKNGEIHLDTKEIVQTEAELEKLNNQKAKLERWRKYIILY